MNPAVLRAIASIEESAWVPIHYPKAIWDEQEQRLVSDAQVAEVPFTAFTSRRLRDRLDGRLIAQTDTVMDSAATDRLRPRAEPGVDHAAGARPLGREPLGLPGQPPPQAAQHESWAGTRRNESATSRKASLMVSYGAQVSATWSTVIRIVIAYARRA